MNWTHTMERSKYGRENYLFLFEHCGVTSDSADSSNMNCKQMPWQIFLYLVTSYKQVP